VVPRPACVSGYVLNVSEHGWAISSVSARALAVCARQPQGPNRPRQGSYRLTCSRLPADDEFRQAFDNLVYILVEAFPMSTQGRSFQRGRSGTAQVLDAIHGERGGGGGVTGGERGVSRDSGCGWLACDDILTVSDSGRPSP